MGDELTSGRSDVKEERLYFGLELSEEDPRVHAGLPLHGPNLFLAGIAGFGDTILQYMVALTDYGVLTILKQDDVGGLQVKVRSRWIDAPPVPNSFVCNIGDMLDRLTRGLYRPTHHRVQNVSGRSRFSFPFFFDPGFEAIDLSTVQLPEDNKEERWDHASVHEFESTYGDYVLGKVAKVFPELRRKVM